MSGHAGYQPLGQSVDEITQEVDVVEENLASSSLSVPTRGRRAARRGSIDLKKLDNAFKRQMLFLNFTFSCTYLLYSWTESIAQRVKRKKKTLIHARKPIWHSVFEPAIVIPSTSGGTVSSVDLSFFFSSSPFFHVR